MEFPAQELIEHLVDLVVKLETGTPRFFPLALVKSEKTKKKFVRVHNTFDVFDRLHSESTVQLKEC